LLLKKLYAKAPKEKKAERGNLALSPPPPGVVLSSLVVEFKGNEVAL
jgi:hypothetical protein